ncbi:phage-related tail protein [Roseibium sp. TrichSKD4]|nr:phage tail protein [Roseibium sp. TrichSKD4]EFO33586.1 phage-related tail protein [Roseibium sp. TrichSKD4]
MLSGAVLGRWVGTSLQETRTLFDANGMPSKVETQLRLTRYVPGPISTELRTGLF